MSDWSEPGDTPAIQVLRTNLRSRVSARNAKMKLLVDTEYQAEQASDRVKALDKEIADIEKAITSLEYPGV